MLTSARNLPSCLPLMQQYVPNLVTRIWSGEIFASLCVLIKSHIVNNLYESCLLPEKQRGRLLSIPIKTSPNNPHTKHWINSWFMFQCVFRGWKFDASVFSSVLCENTRFFRLVETDPLNLLVKMPHMVWFSALMYQKRDFRLSMPMV